MTDSSIATELRIALSRLWGIKEARVEADEAGAIDIRALVLPERAGDVTVAHVISVAQSLGIDVDPARVELLLTEPTSLAPEPARRQIAAITTTRYEETFTVSVSLALHGDSLTGQGSCPSGLSSELRCVAEATVEAAQTLFEVPVTIGMVGVFDLGMVRSLLVVCNRGSGVLVGSAVVRSDIYDAAVRATMDALNRFIVPRGPSLVSAR